MPAGILQCFDRQESRRSTNLVLLGGRVMFADPGGSRGPLSEWNQVMKSHAKFNFPDILMEMSVSGVWEILAIGPLWWHKVGLMLKMKNTHHCVSFWHAFADGCKQRAKCAAFWDVKDKCFQHFNCKCDACLRSVSNTGNRPFVMSQMGDRCSCYKKKNIMASVSIVCKHRANSAALWVAKGKELKCRRLKIDNHLNITGPNPLTCCGVWETPCLTSQTVFTDLVGYLDSASNPSHTHF